MSFWFSSSFDSIKPVNHKTSESLVNHCLEMPKTKGVCLISVLQSWFVTQTIIKDDYRYVSSIFETRASLAAQDFLSMTWGGTGDKAFLPPVSMCNGVGTGAQVLVNAGVSCVVQNTWSLMFYDLWCSMKRERDRLIEWRPVYRVECLVDTHW